MDIVDSIAVLYWIFSVIVLGFTLHVLGQVRNNKSVNKTALDFTYVGQWINAGVLILAAVTMMGVGALVLHQDRNK